MQPPEGARAELRCLRPEGSRTYDVGPLQRALGPRVWVRALPDAIDLDDLARQVVRRPSGLAKGLLTHGPVAASVRAAALQAQTFLFVVGTPPPAEGMRTSGAPIIAFAAAEDPAHGPAAMLGWADRTTGAFDLRTLPGRSLQRHGRGAEILAAGLAPGINEALIGRTAGPVRPDQDEVHLLAVNVDRYPRLATASPELSPSEQERGSRLRTPLLRDRYLARRILVRTFLRRYGAAMGTAEFAVGPSGKPALPFTGGPGFSVSSSGAVVLLALTASSPVGVDVESLRPIPDMWSFIGRALHPDERAELAARPADRQVHRALELWTAKEALLKGTGDGLQIDPDAVSFAGGSSGGTWTARVPEELARLRPWLVTPLALPGVLAAIATTLPRWRLRAELRLGGTDTGSAPALP